MNSGLNKLEAILATLTSERRTSSIPVLPMPSASSSFSLHADDLGANSFLENRRSKRRATKKKKQVQDPMRQPWSFISLMGGRPGLLDPSTQH